MINSTYEIKLVSGEVFVVDCQEEDIDTLILAIGEEQIEYCEQL